MPWAFDALFKTSHTFFLREWVLQDFAITHFCADFKMQVLQFFSNACNQFLDFGFGFVQPGTNGTLSKESVRPRKAGVF